MAVDWYHVLLLQVGDIATYLDADRGEYTPHNTAPYHSTLSRTLSQHPIAAPYHTIFITALTQHPSAALVVPRVAAEFPSSRAA